MALSNHQIFQKIEQNKIRDLLEDFIKKCRKIETKKHLIESVHLIEMANLKMQNIQVIL